MHPELRHSSFRRYSDALRYFDDRLSDVSQNESESESESQRGGWSSNTSMDDHDRSPTKGAVGGFSPLRRDSRSEKKRQRGPTPHTHTRPKSKNVTPTTMGTRSPFMFLPDRPTAPLGINRHIDDDEDLCFASSSFGSEEGFDRTAAEEEEGEEDCSNLSEASPLVYSPSVRRTQESTAKTRNGKIAPQPATKKKTRAVKSPDVDMTPSSPFLGTLSRWRGPAVRQAMETRAHHFDDEEEEKGESADESSQSSTSRSSTVTDRSAMIDNEEEIFDTKRIKKALREIQKRLESGEQLGAEEEDNLTELLDVIEAFQDNAEAQRTQEQETENKGSREKEVESDSILPPEANPTKVKVPSLQPASSSVERQMLFGDSFLSSVKSHQSSPVKPERERRESFEAKQRRGRQQRMEYLRQRGLWGSRGSDQEDLTAAAWQQHTESPRYAHHISSKFFPLEAPEDRKHSHSHRSSIMGEGLQSQPETHSEGASPATPDRRFSRTIPRAFRAPRRESATDKTPQTQTRGGGERKREEARRGTGGDSIPSLDALNMKRAMRRMKKVVEWQREHRRPEKYHSMRLAAPMAIVAPLDISRPGLVPLRQCLFRSHAVLRLLYGRLATSVFELSPLSDTLVFITRILSSWCLLICLNSVVLLKETDENLLPHKPVTLSTAPESFLVPGYRDLTAFAPSAVLKATATYLTGLVLVGVAIRSVVAGVWASETTCGRLPRSAFVVPAPAGLTAKCSVTQKSVEGDDQRMQRSGLKRASSVLDRAYGGGAARLLYYPFGPSLSRRAPRVVLNRRECVAMYARTRKHEKSTQLLLAFTCACFLAVLIALYLVLYFGDEAHVLGGERNRENLWYEHSVSLMVMLGFEVVQTVSLGILHAAILSLSLRSRLADPLLNLVPGLFTFPHLSPLRARLRGHEPMVSVDGLTAASWMVPLGGTEGSGGESEDPEADGGSSA
uniref:Uncharacterized protein n=1 Tax=Chromera velia CCMP2878 TaxID=1169474 RepID=A0A0G4HKI6_9ALVE|eukprot:Cvel_7305.t1-p1 / transcript=Cvel_7305.t1 / gene=Cvel_7305 / organism=Chromera_velia_CCMP2878 / gene_product=hypothetical protein / transcript_product=hypothetical protein / location=Cvel_scaffold378:27511-31509(-) / protein_length=956 / sequence_SO=supercontig / SO=protein_coding / is_pseudo=false